MLPGDVRQGERRALDPTRTLLGRPTSCVGREEELTVLEATFARAAEGAGPEVALITAGSGAGKSRLRHELVRRLELGSPDRATVVVCQGDPLHVTTPYAQVAQIVRQMAQLQGRDDIRQIRERLRAHVAEHVSEKNVMRVTDFLGELLGAQFDDDDHLALRAARHNEPAMADQIRTAFEDILRAWARRRPILLVMEDLHWTDAMSLKLVDTALRKLAGVRLMVLALARDEVHARFPALWAHRPVTRVRLPPLSAQASGTLVVEVMGESAPREEVVRIVDRAEGNAFYLEELIREAVESVPPDGTSAPASPRGALLDAVTEVAKGRLRRLHPEVRRVLRTASIFGEAFWREGVEELLAARGRADIVAPILGLLGEREAVVPQERSRLLGAQELTFRHAFLCEAAYATLSAEERLTGHRLAAEWLTRRDEDREVVALHWLEGGDRERAGLAFADAAEARLSRAQADAAVRCALRSLLVTDPDAGTPLARHAWLTRLRLLADGLEVVRRLDPVEVMAGLERHVVLPDEGLGERPALALLHLALARSARALRGAPNETLAIAAARAACTVGALGDFAGGKRLIAEATDVVRGDEASTRFLRYASAKIAFWEGEWGALVENLSTTVLPADTRERVAMLLILATAVVSVDGREALPRGLEYVARAEALVARSSDDPVAEVSCCKARLICFFFAGEFQRAAEVAEEAIALSRKAGLRFDEALHLHNLGDCSLRLGNTTRARAALLESNAIASDLEVPTVRHHNDLILAFIDLDVARFDDLVAEVEASGNAWREMHTRYWFGRTLATKGSDRARRELERALALARELKVHGVAEECAAALAALPPVAAET